MWIPLYSNGTALMMRVSWHVEAGHLVSSSDLSLCVP